VYQSFVDTQHKNGHLPTWCQWQTVYIHCTEQKSLPFSVIELTSRFFGDCIIVGVKSGLKNKTAYTIEENDMLVLHSTNIREELAEPMRTNEIRKVPTTHAGGQASEEPGEIRIVREAEEA
jgi:hypothetical protein